MQPPHSNRGVYILLLCYLFATAHCDERIYTQVSGQCGDANPISVTSKSRLHCAITCLRLGEKCAGFVVTSSPDNGLTSSVKCDMYINLGACTSPNGIWKYKPAEEIKPPGKIQSSVSLSLGMSWKVERDVWRNDYISMIVPELRTLRISDTVLHTSWGGMGRQATGRSPEAHVRVEFEAKYLKLFFNCCYNNCFLEGLEIAFSGFQFSKFFWGDIRIPPPTWGQHFSTLICSRRSNSLAAPAHE